jgi:hypothetical protein
LHGARAAPIIGPQESDAEEWLKNRDVEEWLKNHGAEEWLKNHQQEK